MFWNARKLCGQNSLQIFDEYVAAILEEKKNEK